MTNELKEKLSYRIVLVANSAYMCYTYLDDKRICRCKIDISGDKKVWTISEWFIDDDFLKAGEYQHKGIGKSTMKYLVEFLLNTFGKPDTIDYDWNGFHYYVYEWLKKNFEPVSKCSQASLKYATERLYDEHIYHLNVEKYLAYFSKNDF